ncbi:MAG: helix-turn-helix domain-containing protein [Acidimicrobiales bacterium]
MRSSTATASYASLLDINTVADSLGVTPRFVRRLVAERRIPYVKVGKFVRFDPGELDMWLDQQRVGLGPRFAASPRLGR